MANGAIYDDGGETIRIHDRKLDALVMLAVRIGQHMEPYGIVINDMIGFRRHKAAK